MFQSAPPSRAATSPLATLEGAATVSIRAALTGGDFSGISTVSAAMSFNPRRPHGRRLRSSQGKARVELFQSAPPSRAATRRTPSKPSGTPVSIRAALTGGDPMSRTLACLMLRFNPRRPHGRRPFIRTIPILSLGFQSAPPSRAATRPSSCRSVHGTVSIRAALTGGDK